MHIDIPENYTQTEDGDILPPLHLLEEDSGQYTEYKIWETSIKGLLVWERKQYDDERGAYQEIYKTPELDKALGRHVEFKQGGLSKNKPNGVLRGIHAEPMDKMVTNLNGKIFIAIVDLRPDSKTFKEHVFFVLDQRDLNKPTKSIFVSQGLGNSFLTIGEETDPILLYQYQVGDTYESSEGKRSVKWDDPDLAIPWPMKPTIMSPVDATGNKSLRELFPEIESNETR